MKNILNLENKNIVKSFPLLDYYYKKNNSLICTNLINTIIDYRVNEYKENITYKKISDIRLQESSGRLEYFEDLDINFKYKNFEKIADIKIFHYDLLDLIKSTSDDVTKKATFFIQFNNTSAVSTDGLSICSTPIIASINHKTNDYIAIHKNILLEISQLKLNEYNLEVFFDYQEDIFKIVNKGLEVEFYTIKNDKGNMKFKTMIEKVLSKEYKLKLNLEFFDDYKEIIGKTKHNVIYLLENKIYHDKDIVGSYVQENLTVSYVLDLTKKIFVFMPIKFYDKQEQEQEKNNIKLNLYLLSRYDKNIDILGNDNNSNFLQIIERKQKKVDKITHQAYLKAKQVVQAYENQNK
jgi:hypothetical protein